MTAQESRESTGGGNPRGGVRIDEEPLRQWILKAYHERRGGGQRDREVLDAIRQLLSGPPGGAGHPSQYYFEINPEMSIWRFMGALESAVRGLPSMVFRPLLATLDENGEAGTDHFVSNVSVYVASVAGAMAVKGRLDETLACGLVASGLLALARLGKPTVLDALERVEKLGADEGKKE